MSHALHRSLLQTPLHAVRGDGPYLFDAHGKQYLDGCGGAAVSCLGHSHAGVITAIQKQVAKLPYAHTSFFTTDILETLAEKIVGNAAGMDKVLFLSGGSEAVEAALKLSRQYFVERGRNQKTPLYCSAPELPWQHAGGTFGGWQRMAPRTVQTIARHWPSHCAVLRIPGKVGR